LSDDPAFNVADVLLRRRAPNLEPAALAEVLDLLTWTMDDNGAEILAARRRWMDSEDLYAAEVAITMDEGIPFEPALMLSKLTVLEQRWPRLKARCDVLRDRLRAYGPGYT
jgi:hypothetical protein